MVSARTDPGLDRRDRGVGSARTGLLVISLSTFAAVTTEMAPVGLLPAIGRTFGVGASTTGLLVSLYAVMVAALAVPVTLATKRVPRKLLLLSAVSCYGAGNLIAALAPSFAVLAAGRAVGGAGHALFFAVAIGYAARLVPPAQTGRALALASAGVSAGFVLGVPLATALGNAAGWRAAFGALVALVAVVLILIAVALPDVQSQVNERPPAPGRWRLMAAVIGSNALAFLGHYALYTYVSVLLLRSGLAADVVGPALLLFGGCGLIGVWVAGPQLDRRPRTSALVILAILGAGIAGVGAGFPVLALVLVAGLVWNGAFGPVTSLYQTAAVRAEAMSPELAGAWNNATCNVGIASGAALGGVVLQGGGVQATALVAAGLVGAALLIVVFARRAFPGASDLRDQAATAATEPDGGPVEEAKELRPDPVGPGSFSPARR